MKLSKHPLKSNCMCNTNNVTSTRLLLLPLTPLSLQGIVISWVDGRWLDIWSGLFFRNYQYLLKQNSICVHCPYLGDMHMCELGDIDLQNLSGLILNKLLFFYFCCISTTLYLTVCHRGMFCWYDLCSCYSNIDLNLLLWKMHIDFIVQPNSHLVLMSSFQNGYYIQLCNSWFWASLTVTMVNWYLTWTFFTFNSQPENGHGNSIQYKVVQHR